MTDDNMKTPKILIAFFIYLGMIAMIVLGILISQDITISGTQKDFCQQKGLQYDKGYCYKIQGDYIISKFKIESIRGNYYLGPGYELNPKFLNE